MRCGIKLHYFTTRRVILTHGGGPPARLYKESVCLLRNGEKTVTMSDKYAHMSTEELQGTFMSRYLPASQGNMLDRSSLEAALMLDDLAGFTVTGVNEIRVDRREVEETQVPQTFVPENRDAPDSEYGKMPMDELQDTFHNRFTLPSPSDIMERHVMVAALTIADIRGCRVTKIKGVPVQYDKDGFRVISGSPSMRSLIQDVATAEGICGGSVLEGGSAEDTSMHSEELELEIK